MTAGTNARNADVVVVGGGLAGTSCAIELATAGFRVALFEGKEYPRHKMCGEFLSAQGRMLLFRLGVGGALDAVRHATIRELRLSEASGRSCAATLPEAATGVSRYDLDTILSVRARECGVHVEEGTSVASISGSLMDSSKPGFDVVTGDRDGYSWSARVVVGAWGRSSSLDRSIRGAAVADSPWVAFKAHFEGAMPSAVEIHAFDRGYCGVAPIESGAEPGLINVCWIMHRDRIPPANPDRFSAMLAGVLSENLVLADRLSGLRPLWDKPLSASQLVFTPTTPFASDVCLVGDAAGMVAPLFGDGMTMALASGIRAAREIGRFLRAEVGAAGLSKGYTSAWNMAFSRRMLLGRIAHAALTNPRRARTVVELGRRAPAALRTFVRMKSIH